MMNSRKGLHDSFTGITLTSKNILLPWLAIASLHQDSFSFAYFNPMSNSMEGACTIILPMSII